MSDNIIKSIVEAECPHCERLFYIESKFTPPTIGSVFTEEELVKAKTDLLERLPTLEIDEERKESVTKWINDTNTVFAPLEVENIVLSLLNPGE